MDMTYGPCFESTFHWKLDGLKDTKKKRQLVSLGIICCRKYANANANALKKKKKERKNDM